VITNALFLVFLASYFASKIGPTLERGHDCLKTNYGAGFQPFFYFPAVSWGVAPGIDCRGNEGLKARSINFGCGRRPRWVFRVLLSCLRSRSANEADAQAMPQSHARGAS
jgi:hypothetical protein